MMECIQTRALNNRTLSLPHYNGIRVGTDYASEVFLTQQQQKLQIIPLKFIIKFMIALGVTIISCIDTPSSNIRSK